MNVPILNTIKRLIPGKTRASPLVQKFLKWIRIHGFLARKIKKQLSFYIEDTTAKPYLGKRVFVPIIETSHYQHYHVLSIAKSLQVRGAKVKILVCGEVLEGCEIKSIRKIGDADPCWSCRFNARYILPLFNFETVTLADIISGEEMHGIKDAVIEALSKGETVRRHEVNLEQAILDSTVRYYYGAVPVDEGAVAKVRQEHAITAAIAAEVAHRINTQWNPDIVFSNMSCYSTWEPFYKYFHARNNKFRLISITQFNYKSIVLDQFRLFGTSNRFARYIDSRPTRGLSGSEREELYRFVGERHTGESAIFKSLGFFNSTEDLELDTRFGFDSEKRNIFLFPNIYWDVGISDCGDLYNGVVEWVLDTINLLKNCPSVNLYIKPHPGEVFDTASSLKGIKDIINEHFPEIPSNIKIIDPAWKIKTYDLFPHIDVGVIFMGTLGLEMMLAGIQVVSTGKTTHFGLGFASEPKTKEEYLALLLGEKIMPRYPKEDLELFAYFYFIRTNMPWTLTKQAYGDQFDGFSFDSLNDLLPGKDQQLDHLCKCIMEMDNTVIEAWPSKPSNNLIASKE